MLPWIQIDSAKAPGGGELRLMRRSDEFSITIGGNELMNSRLSGSEEALAQLACERIRGRRAPKLLIGGLGMGFTLRAALAELGADAAITVAELVPAIVRWARGPMADIFGDCLDDPRVAIHEGDVGQLMRASRSRFDAILLDVDNGPHGLTSANNDGLYDFAGLGAAKQALRPGGVLAVWSAGPDREFSQRLRDVGFQAQQKRARAHGGRGARHIIWLATVSNAAQAMAPRASSKRR